jgi:hypothetical protein
MPTKKQRRRREKTFRHEYDYVTYDEDGNEIALDPEELRAKREAREQERAASRPEKKHAPEAKSRSGRPLREVPPPTWNRALKRGGGMGAVMLVLILFVFTKESLPVRAAEGIGYAVLFVPLTYWIDRAAYRTYQRRLERAGRKT